MVAEHNGEGIF